MIVPLPCMKGKLHLIVCENYMKEVNKLIASEKIINIKIHSHPAVCDRFNISSDNRYKGAIKKLKQTYGNHYIVGCTRFINFSDSDGDTLTPSSSEQEFTCFDLLINKTFINQLISEGNYLLSPGWLLKWKFYIEEYWKFNREQAIDFFRESAKKLLLLDTGIRGEMRSHLVQFAEYVKLPYEIMSVGMDHFRLLFTRDFEKRKYEKELLQTKQMLNEEKKTASNYALAFDLISQLAEIDTESKIIEGAKEIITALFAPKRVSFIPFHQSGNLIIDDRQRSEIKDLVLFPGEHLIHNNDAGFSILIKHEGKSLGILMVQDLMFKQHLQNYLRLCKFISQVIGLGITNARQYEDLLLVKSNLIAAKNVAETANNTKDKFLSIISHDLRNPVSTMIGLSELLHDDYYSMNDNERLKMVKLFARDSVFLLELLENLLQWTHSQSNKLKFKPVKIDVLGMVEKVKILFEGHLQSKKLDLKIGIQPGLCIYGDKNMIMAIIRNLLANAIKFTNQGGHILVSVMQVKEKVKLRITDTGVGMDEKTILNLFNLEKMQSTKGTANETGTGLGLILCKEFVTKNGGEISVSSTPGKGSTFLVSLPSC